MRRLKLLVMASLMGLGYHCMAHTAVDNYVMQIEAPVMTSLPSTSTVDTTQQSDQFSAQVVEHLLLQWPVEALNLQLASMQQEILQLQQQLALLSNAVPDQQTSATVVGTRRPQGIIGGVVLAHPISSSLFFLIIIMGIAGWLLSRRWRVIQANEMTLPHEDLHSGSHDKIASQLDMAMSYFSLEQYEQALALIKQVLNHGNDQQRTEAQLLQQQIQQAVG
ncbi:MAG: hypothetical protein GKR77_07260 [Legionellales bacterium]|nr:hypothetical protein [Legionellales bacterium]